MKNNRRIESLDIALLVDAAFRAVKSEMIPLAALQLLVAVVVYVPLLIPVLESFISITCLGAVSAGVASVYLKYIDTGEWKIDEVFKDSGALVRGAGLGFIAAIVSVLFTAIFFSAATLPGVAISGSQQPSAIVAFFGAIVAAFSFLFVHAVQQIFAFYILVDQQVAPLEALSIGRRSESAAHLNY